MTDVIETSAIILSGSYFQKALGNSIYNYHDRVVACSADRVGALMMCIDQPDSVLWPREAAGPIVLDAPLGFGAKGGHGGGRVSYTVVEYIPNRRIMFRFDNGQDSQDNAMVGVHYFEVEPTDEAEKCTVRYVLNAEMRGDRLDFWMNTLGLGHDAAIRLMFQKLEAAIAGGL